ncbi:hypothetical protein [Polymorphobacter megasporae]|uniref:hypothetical protein n=1 Tax=Glacieibacterium megasporae TaxID=2835787 RepID=UPI001C1E2174|nr:hypothetical protein [Polymorphobacter megasporae]UAJ09323.1 hypothetical protein KTC28_13500 [Polymorphobacter megasporae]
MRDPVMGTVPSVVVDDNHRLGFAGMFGGRRCRRLAGRLRRDERRRAKHRCRDHQCFEGHISLPSSRRRIIRLDAREMRLTIIIPTVRYASARALRLITGLAFGDGSVISVTVNLGIIVTAFAQA